MTLPGQPRSTSSGSTGNRNCEFPRHFDFSAIRASLRRVSPALLGLSRRRCVPEHPRAPHPPVLAGDRAASLPASRLLWRLRLLSSGCPRNWSSTSSASDASPGIPEYASSGCADGESPGRPAPSCPSAMPIGGSPGSPGFRTFRPFRVRVSGLPRLCGYGWVNDVSPPSLELCILGLSCKPFPGCPRFMRPLAVPRMNLQAQSGRAIPA